MSTLQIQDIGGLVTEDVQAMPTTKRKPLSLVFSRDASMSRALADIEIRGIAEGNPLYLAMQAVADGNCSEATRLLNDIKTRIGGYMWALASLYHPGTNS